MSVPPFAFALHAIKSAVLPIALLAQTPSAMAQTSAAQTSAAQPTTTSGNYSHYEQASIDEATARTGSPVDPAPEGKVVEGIDIVPLDVIEPRDPAPHLLNSLHATTRPRIIEREVLMQEGDVYHRALCEETARNLRLLPQLSLVICTATQGKTGNGVRILVITKDVWSLRLGWDVSFIGGLESLQLVPTETNIGGTHQIVLARYIYQPLSQSFSLGYRIPRVAGLRLGLASEAGVIWNRDGHVEGSAGSLIAYRPQYSAQVEWAWSMGTVWRDEILRRYINAQLATYDAAVTPGNDAIPWQYRARRFSEGINVTRSFGWATKNDFTFGAEMSLLDYRPPTAPGASPAALAEFARVDIPTSDTRVGPFVQYRGYTSNFLRVLDFESLGLQEDFRLGHDIWVRLYPVTQALGSSRSFFGSYGAFQYTIGLGDGLARFAVESSLEAESSRLSDAAISAGLRIVTPRLGLGRLVFDAGALNRFRNYMNRQSFLGGDGRLRGYPSSFFAGKDLVAYNLEYRSRPVEILSVQLGGAAFYDVGDAAIGFDRLHPRQSVGCGLRILFPQLDRLVFRADIGFPLAQRLDPGIAPYAITVSFEQAFSLPAVGGLLRSDPAVGWLGQ